MTVSTFYRRHTDQFFVLLTVGKDTLLKEFVVHAFKTPKLLITKTFGRCAGRLCMRIYFAISSWPVQKIVIAVCLTPAAMA